MTDARNQKLIQLFLDEKAYVHMVSSPLDQPVHRKFIIDQFKNLGTNKPRPVRQLDSNIDRRAELNPSTGQYEWRTTSKDADRGKAKPNKLYIKAKCCTLAPQDARIHYYATTGGHPIALVFNSDFCDQTTINKHIYGGGGVVITNHRKRLYSKNRTSKEINVIVQHQFVSDNQSTATDKLKAYNRFNRQRGIIAPYTENESVKPSIAALEHGGILAPKDDLITRLNALDFKNYIKQELNLDLPIAIGGPDVDVKPYTLSQQCEDVFNGIVSKNNVSYQFSKKIWESGNITREHILALDDARAGSCILDLVNAKQWHIAKLILETRNTFNIRFFNQSKDTALHIAIKNDQMDLVNLLYKKTNIAFKNANNQSALSMVLFTKNYNLVENLINNSIVPDHPDSNDQLAYAIFFLIRAAQYQLAETILDKYSDRNLSTLTQKMDAGSGCSAWHYAARNLPATATLMKKLINAGACNGRQKNIFVPYGQHISLLSLATEEWQDTRQVKLILRYSALQFNNANAHTENDEIKKASRFLMSQQQLDLQFLIHLHGDLVNKRRVAILILSECFYAAKNIKDILSILIELEKWKPAYLYDRQQNFGVSFRRHQWLGNDTSHTWIDIMKMGKARLLELYSQEKNTALSTEAINYLQQKTSGWASKSSDSKTFKLFKKMHNPIAESELKQYIEKSKNRVMSMT